MSPRAASSAKSRNASCGDEWPVVGADRLGDCEALRFRGHEGVDEPGDGQQGEQSGGDIGDDRGLGRLDAELAEPVRGQQQTAQCLALE